MKTKINSVILFLLCISLFNTSCEKEEVIIQKKSNLTNEISKIETIYHQGDVKLENVIDEIKSETEADFYFKDKIRTELDKSYSKQSNYLKSGSNLVGVFKNGSCGGNAELIVFMDCEDRRPISSKNGWTGDSYIDNNKNAYLKFCVVNNAFFERTNVDFAVLNLTNDLPLGVSRIVRYFDNEDSNNINNTLYNGSVYTGFLGDCWFGGNTRLSFYYYPQSFIKSASLPNLGFSYYVLGRFGDFQGSILTDDEDSNNTNWCYMDKWEGTGYISGYSGNIENIMNVDGNTRLYLSKAN